MRGRGPVAGLRIAAAVSHGATVLHGRSTHRISMSRRRTVLHGGVRVASSATTVSSAAAKATSRAVIRSLVNANGSSVKSIRCLLASGWTTQRRDPRRAKGTRGGFVLDIVHSGDGLLRIFLLVVSDESKSTATASVPVLDHNLGIEARSESGFVVGEDFHVGFECGSSAETAAS